ncbi:hypothetical protein BASA62_003337 [Batrachochytrium salamandrivorans]|nr:hypothetical protein BASA62_003337 [Batrachochytrium salamandrivorans]
MEEQADRPDDGWIDDSSSDEGSESAVLTKSAAKFRLKQGLREADRFYDDRADDMDEIWAQRKHQNPHTDSVLLCPLCFTPVCYDCQRHDVYASQFRAMFVENCHVVQNEILRYGNGKYVPGIATSKDSSTKAQLDEALKPNMQEEKDKVQPVDRPQDIYHPVRCDSCECEVAVYDHEEVYHFFNVIAQ